MRLFNRNPESDLEARLRAERPEPGSELVHAIVARVEGATELRRPRSLRLAFAAASVGALAALGALGGVSYAASSVEHAATAVKNVFVAKAPKGEARKGAPFKAATALIPAKTAAGDQYAPPGGPFLPPGTSPQNALQTTNKNADTAIDKLIGQLNCAAKRGAAKAACLRTQQALKAQKAKLDGRFSDALGALGSLPPDKAAAVATMLAIHLQEQQKLLAGQAARRTKCAQAAFKNTPLCKNLDQKEAKELLKLSTLQLQELENFLAT